MLWAILAVSFFVNGTMLYQDVNGTIEPLYLRGVNWFGFETQDHVVHGLWARNYKDMLDQIKSLGFNAIRLPFCTYTILNSTPTSINYNLNPDLQGLNSLEIMKKVVEEAEKRGIYVLLDYHRIGCTQIEPLWYTQTFTEQDYINTWIIVAREFKNYSNVIGADLKNEPHGGYYDGATWGYDPARDWDKAASRIGNAILQEAPHWLIFVEGTQVTNPAIDGSYQWGLNAWWGGNLMAAQQYPVNLPRDKLVYSPHVYGPDVYNQPYFNDPNFPNNMPDIWETHFGYLSTDYPVIIGEFGGRYEGKDRIWQQKIVDWMLSKNMCSFFYWSWNPNSGDTGGILQDDWRSVYWEKYNNLKRLFNCSGYVESSTPLPDFDSILSQTWLQVIQSSNRQDPLTYRSEYFNITPEGMEFWMCNSSNRVELRFKDEWTIPAENGSFHMSFTFINQGTAEATIFQIMSRNNSYYKPLIRVYVKNGELWVTQRLSLYQSQFRKVNLGQVGPYLNLTISNSTIWINGRDFNVSDWPYRNFFKTGIYIQSGGCAKLIIHNLSFATPQNVSLPPVDQPPNNSTSDPSPPSPSSRSLDYTFEITSDWGEGFCARITVQNNENQPVDWTIEINKSFNFTINNYWSSNIQENETTLIISGVSWNNILDPGESTEVGFCAERISPPTTQQPSTTSLPYQIRVTSDWNTGFCVKVTVENDQQDTVEWRISIPKNFSSIRNAWSSEYQEYPNEVVFRGVSWNRFLSPGETTTFGFCANK